MEKISFPVEELGRVIKATHNFKKLERALNVTITVAVQDGIATITAKSRQSSLTSSFDEYIALKAIEALTLGFDVNVALQLKDTDVVLNKIDIKARARRGKPEIIKGRIIGKQGKTKRYIESLTNCNIAFSRYVVGIIGKVEAVEAATEAIEALIRGAPQSRVIANLQQKRAKLKQLEQEVIEKAIIH